MRESCNFFAQALHLFSLQGINEVCGEVYTKYIEQEQKFITKRRNKTSEAISALPILNWGCKVL